MSTFFKIILTGLYLLAALPLYAQRDSVSYEQQREKINQMLTERSNAFGQYYESLDKRTGIFGLQSRQDIRNSNEILRQIVLSDNDIFKQLKTLLEYKDQRYEANLALERAKGQQADDFKASVLRMQQANLKLKNQLKQADVKNSALLRYLVLSLLFLGGISVYAASLFRKYKRSLSPPAG